MELPFANAQTPNTTKPTISTRSATNPSAPNRFQAFGRRPNVVANVHTAQNTETLPPNTRPNQRRILSEGTYGMPNLYPSISTYPFRTTGRGTLACSG